MLDALSMLPRKAQEAGTGSGPFSGDRAPARRKGLEAEEATKHPPQGLQGRKRSEPIPATLPAGEARGFGGKAPGENAEIRLSDCQREGELHPIGRSFSLTGGNFPANIHDIDLGSGFSTSFAGCLNGHCDVIVDAHGVLAGATVKRWPKYSNPSVAFCFLPLIELANCGSDLLDRFVDVLLKRRHGAPARLIFNREGGSLC